MSTFPDDPQTPDTHNGYFIDPESAAEMARLMHQHRMITQASGALFPTGADTSRLHRILDIGCGPGGWVLDVAFALPKVKVTGIDISQTMIDYAQAQAWSRGLSNTTFAVMDALQDLDFPDAGFDWVNARLIQGFMRRTAWSKLLQDVRRILRPGGILCLTEYDSLSINGSPALFRLGELASRAMFAAGIGFSQTQSAVTATLTRLLKQAGYEKLHQQAFALDFSAGSEAHNSNYQNYMVAFKLLQPFIVKLDIATQEEVERLYQDMLIEMLDNDFCAIIYGLAVWGSKV